MSESLNQRIVADMKAAMKAGDKQRLGVIRLIRAAIKQREVDERITLDDDQIIASLDKMVKQRRESITQYRAGDRDDLAEVEQFEIEVIQDYLPTPLSEEEIGALIEEAMTQTSASSIREMGKVMGWLKPKMQGRADMGQVSALIKKRLS